MASNKTVIVLTPNGRRQTIKVTPNTTILQILEEVCRKQGFNSEEYDLKHYNNVLDVSSILRFTGLPNNATLEMCTIQRARRESMITVGLQLENGERMTGEFSPDDNLWNIIMKMCTEGERKENLVVIYMRQEVYGFDALNSTTLRSFGLTAGRAMLRIIYRSPEELKKQANISAPLPSKPVEEKPYVRKLQKLDDSGSSAVTASSHEAQSNPPRKNEEQDSRKDDNEQPSTSKQNQNKTNYIMNFIKQEKEKTGSTTTIKKDKIVKPTQGNQKLYNSGSSQEAMEVDHPKHEPKSSIEEFVFLGERNAMAFSLEMADAVPHEDLPDEFFELTIQDARKLFHDLKKKREELENKPLETDAHKKLEESKKVLRHLHKYKSSVLRIQFPDRTVLQGTFKPFENIEQVMDFVREYLQDKTLDFHLYTTPPKKIIDKTQTLAEAECVPSAVVHFGLNNAAAPNANLLRHDIFNLFVSPSIASIAACKLMKKNPKSVNFDLQDSSSEDLNHNSTYENPTPGSSQDPK